MNIKIVARRILFSVLILSLGWNLVVSAALGELRWYAKQGNNNQAPKLEEQFEMIRKYDCFYLDENASEEDKVIYLTFDAGYENGNIETILGILREHDAEAAFFILEHLVRNNTELVRTMLEDGHLVCNHTATHKNMANVKNEAAFQEEMRRMEQAFEECLGEEIAKFYRPPEGSFTEENLRFAQNMGYKTVFWSLAYADWDNNHQPNPEIAVDKLLKNTHNGMILLLHPTSKTNADILHRLLCEWEQMGYRFASLDELEKAQ